jgi:hypothetical protein
MPLRAHFDTTTPSRMLVQAVRVKQARMSRMAMNRIVRRWSLAGWRVSRKDASWKLEVES